ncbi:C-type lectin domain family 4 member F-like isoform X2 [Dreissena polymorpha]|uniref:C-type lectin domain-containing protein n=1 Tax=Dreissena polymorpha TaxID=45954 RepID=A0A9D4R7X0_DREPO|nr:C-type lectin domain family 4 member F-like isoform X2 [Dreissena polymorpha]KAH3858346.1 hypothetical protein DPMN_100969 [Dreissena polymorpha]
MAYVVKLTVISLLIAVVCSSGLVNVLDRKINAIKDGMEAEIALLRHDIGNFSSQLAHLLHGTDGFSSKIQNVSQCGYEKAEKGPTSDQFVFNQVIRKGFESEKKSMKNDFEMIHRYVNSTINDVDRMGQSLTSYKVNLIETKSHVKRINDITVDQSREILAIKEQMESVMTRKGFESEKKSLKNDVETIHSFVNSTLNDVHRTTQRINDITVYQSREIRAIKEQMESVMTRKGFESEKKSMKNDVERIHGNVNSTMNDVDRMNRSMASYIVDNSELKSHVKRIDDITVIQSREILAIKQQMESVMTKLDSLNETFKRRLEGVERHISALYGFDAMINKLDTDFNRRLEGVKRETSALPDFEAMINKLEADFNKPSRFQALSASSSSVRLHDTSIYVLGKKRTDYHSASKVCSDVGGYLVEINSEEENAIIMEMSDKSSVSGCYLGGSDRVTEGNWKWEHSGDSIPMRNQGKFQKWAENQPNTGTHVSDEHCLVMHTDSGEWHDYNCRGEWAYVCEVGLVNILAYW